MRINLEKNIFGAWCRRIFLTGLLAFAFTLPTAFAEVIDPSVEDYAVTAEMLDEDHADYDSAALNKIGQEVYKYMQFKGSDGLTENQIAAADVYFEGSQAHPEVGGSSGDTAWMITATVLVLFMTLPGLALFYGGLVRAKNVLSVLMHCFAIACLASILWVVYLYSMGFSDGNAILGDMQHLFLNGVGGLNGNTYPETVFVMFQMTFAIITPALVVGAFVERMRFGAVLLFTFLWLTIVYVPVAHWVWASAGWMFKADTIDLAGGIVVHTTAGLSALVLAKMLGSRKGFPDSVKPPHNPGMVMIGAAMLWVGWFGFNAGSQGAANEGAGLTMLVTHIAAATASLTWMVVEKIKTGKSGLVGIVTGMVAGLATITPASGEVGPIGALILGFLAGIACYFACGFVKEKLGVDDTLDVFAVHGVGGMMGSILVAVLATSTFGGSGLTDGTVGAQLVTQLIGVGATAALSIVGTVVIVFIIKATVGLRVSDEEENEGLDQSVHGESGYTLD